jgi:hypothetical protein
MMNEQSRMSAMNEKIFNKIFQNPDYFSLGAIDLKQGVCNQFGGI